jgi:hypothetical protein
MAKRQPLPDVLGNILTERPSIKTELITPESNNTSTPALQDSVSSNVEKTPHTISQLEEATQYVEDDINIGKTKATFYLSREITQALEDTWMHLRRRGGKGRPASKSILVEAALRRTLDELKQNGLSVLRSV